MNLLSDVTFSPEVKVETARSFEPFPSGPPVLRQPSPRVAVKVRGKILFINLADVVSVHAEGNYVALRGSSGNHLLRESISTVAERLEPYGFIRIHRSVLVNAAFVEEIRPYSTGEYGLRVKGGKEHTVTRTYKKNLKSLAEFWMGTGTFFSD
jgi:DNA-binding LytR/AlgR family response regulator